MADPLELVAYCGLHCELCAERARIPERAAALQKAMTDEGWPHWGDSVAGFAEFWQLLEQLQANGGCPGCRAVGGFPGCEIRPCARERGLAHCSERPDFPCQRIEALAARYPTLIADNRRLQAAGLAQWQAEQEERRRRGFVYADIRYDAVG